MELTVVVPFWNGHDTIGRLLDGLPTDLPVVVVDDRSDRPLNLDKKNVRVVRPDRRGYFSGAVNAGARECAGDFLILNQDAELRGTAWLDLIAGKRERFATLGEGVMNHPAWPKGYVQGTFMFVRRDAWDAVGGFDERRYPLWGATCEWQLRACRGGFEALPLDEVPGLVHGDERRELEWRGPGGSRKVRFGSAIAEALLREKRKAPLFIRTPPMVSVVVTCRNYGRYLTDAVNSLLGGATCLGSVPPQTLSSFEVVVVDDASDDGSAAVCRGLADDWKGVRCINIEENVGTPAAMNVGVEAAFGRYVQFLSADDMLEPHVLELHLRTCEANPHGFAFGDLTVLKNGEKIKGLRLPEYDFEKVLRKNTVSAGIMYPKKAWAEVGGYPEVMRYGREDWAFNVALGSKGWCGVHTGDAGYVVRREDQNRSLRTGNVWKGERAQPWDGRDWRAFFQRQMHQLYPELYAGERPMGCCGGRRNKRSSRGGRGSAVVKKNGGTAPMPAGAPGMVILEYVEGNVGTQTFIGPVTETPYVFGGKRPMGYVDARDVKEMVDMRNNRRPIFRRVGPRDAPVEKPPPAAVEHANPPAFDGVPDPNDFSVKELSKLSFEPEVAAAMLEIEENGQGRKGAVEHLKKLTEVPG